MRELNVYLASSGYHRGEPRVKVERDLVDVWPTGHPGPYLSMTIDDWRALNGAVVNAVAANAVYAASETQS